MIINTRAEIWQVACKDKSRPVLAHIHFDADKKRLIAADGFCLAIINDKIETWKDEEIFSCNIPWKAVQYAVKHGKGNNKNSVLQLCKKGWVVAGYISNYTVTLINDENADTMIEEPLAFPLHRTSDGTIETEYPDLTTIIPDLDVMEPVISLSADKLLRVAKAMTECNEVALTLRQDPKQPSSPIQVVMQNNDNFGMLMPVYDSSRKQNSPVSIKAFCGFELFITQDDGMFTVRARIGKFSIRGHGRTIAEALDVNASIIVSLGDFAPGTSGIDDAQWLAAIKPIRKLLMK